MRANRPAPANGFSMIEILVAVFIVGLLATAAFSTGDMMIRKARATQSLANLKSLAIANASYQADQGEFCPADDQYNLRRWHGARGSAEGGFDPTKGFLAPYLGESRQVGVCPLFKNMVNGSGSFESGTGGYGYNAAYIGGRPGGMFNKVTKLRVSAKMAVVEDPVRTVMFTTTAYALGGGRVQEYPYCEPPFWDHGSGPSGDRPSPTVHFRADGKALVAWCDGHVSAEARTEAAAGENPHGGDSESQDLGWFGRDENNGYWNTRKE